MEKKFKLPDGSVVDAQIDSLPWALKSTLDPVLNLSCMLFPNEGNIDASSVRLLLDRLHSLAVDELHAVAHAIELRFGQIQVAYRRDDLRTIYGVQLAPEKKEDDGVNLEPNRQTNGEVQS